MTILARLRLGADEADVERFVAEQTSRWEEWPGRQAPITEETFGEALGDPARLTDWRDYFVGRLRPGGWRHILGEWAPRLAPGVMAAATHGLIRTAYGVMYLEEEDTLPRRIELGIGLASWAARFQPLPKPSGRATHADPTALLMDAGLLPAERRVKGLIFTRVKPLNGDPAFPALAGGLAIADPVGALNALSKTAARLYLANPGRSAITFIHCLTATHALRRVGPYVTAPERISAVRHLWSAIAALYMADADAPLTGEEGGALTPEEKNLAQDMSRMEAAALTKDEDHVAKYAFSCREENRLNPDPLYPTALARWLIASDALAT
jgi:hypothetical protein